MGASTAWQLASDGRDVLLLERFEMGHANGSSHGHSRIFRVAYRDSRYSELALQALSWWRILEQECGEILLNQCGQIDHGSHAALDEVAESLALSRRPFERLSQREAEIRWPGIRTVDGCVFSPDGGFVAADRSVAALYGMAVAAGAEIRTDHCVENIELLSANRGVRIATAHGSWTAPVVVVAAGAWVREVLADVVALPPLAVTLATPSHFHPVAADATPWPSVLHHIDARSPLTFGSYAVWAPGIGMKVGLEDTVRSADPNDRAFGPSTEDVAALAEHVAAWFPGLDPTPVDPHTCLFTSTPDEHFVLDRQGPIVVVSPCSGHGFKFVPAIGRLAADLAESPLADAADVARHAMWRLPSWSCNAST